MKLGNHIHFAQGAMVGLFAGVVMTLWLVFALNLLTPEELGVWRQFFIAEPQHKAEVQPAIEATQAPRQTTIIKTIARNKCGFGVEVVKPDVKSGDEVTLIGRASAHAFDPKEKDCQLFKLRIRGKDVVLEDDSTHFVRFCTESESCILSSPLYNEGIKLDSVWVARPQSSGTLDLFTTYAPHPNETEWWNIIQARMSNNQVVASAAKIKGAWPIALGFTGISLDNGRVLDVNHIYMPPPGTQVIILDYANSVTDMMGHSATMAILEVPDGIDIVGLTDLSQVRMWYFDNRIPNTPVHDRSRKW